jgi:hypothetical protein
VEVDRTGNPFIDELLVEPLSIADGQFAPGSKPGLGVELNAAVVEGLRLDDGALRWRFRLVSALSFAGTSALWVFFGMPGVRFLLAGGTAIIGTAGLQRTPSGPPVALGPAETLLGGLPGLGTDQVSLQAGAQDDQERFCGQRYSDVPPGKSGMSVEALVAQEHAFSFWVWPSCLGRSASIPRASLSKACPGSRACSSAAESRRTSCRNRARLPFVSECLAPVGPYCLSEHRRAFPQQFNSPLPPCQGKSLPASVALPVARFELAAPIKPTTDRPGPVESAP